MKIKYIFASIVLLFGLVFAVPDTLQFEVPNSQIAMINSTLTGVQNISSNHIYAKITPTETWHYYLVEGDIKNSGAIPSITPEGFSVKDIKIIKVSKTPSSIVVQTTTTENKTIIETELTPEGDGINSTSIEQVLIEGNETISTTIFTENIHGEYRLLALRTNNWEHGHFNPDISGCGTIDSSGIYTLNQSLNGSGATCLTVTANDVTIDCNNFAIYNTDVGATYGIYSNGAQNLTIINCHISGFQNGIYFLGVDYSHIFNSTINNTHATGQGIYMYNNANYNHVENVLINATYIGYRAYQYTNYNLGNNITVFSSRFGAYFGLQQGCNLTNSYIVGIENTYGALLLYNGNNDSVMENNTINGNGGTRAVTMQSGSNNRNQFINNIIFGSAQMIRLTNGENVTVDCKGLNLSGTNSSTGIYSEVANSQVRYCNLSNFVQNVNFAGVNTGLIENSNFNTSASAGVGIIISVVSKNVRVRNITAYSEIYIGLYISASEYSIVSNSTIWGQQTTWGTVAFINGANSTIFENNTIDGLGGTKGITSGNTLNNSNNTITNNTVSNIVLYSISLFGPGNGVTVDCMGLTYTGGNHTSGIGISTAIDNSVIRNCNTIDHATGISIANAKNVTVENMNITTYDSTALPIIVSNSNYSTLRNIYAYGPTGRSQIYANSHDNLWENITLIGKDNTYGALLVWSSAYDNTFRNIYVDGLNSSMGIRVGNGNDYGNNFTNITMVQVGTGYSIETSDNNTIDCGGRTMTGRNLAFGVSSTSINTIVKNCDMRAFTNGIYFVGAVGGEVRNNTIVEGTAVSSFPIQIRASTGVLVVNNTVWGQDNAYGALLLYLGSTNNTVANNTIDGMGATYAMTVSVTYSANNTIYGNTFLNATNLLYFDGTAGDNIIYDNNFTDIGAPTRYVYDINTVSTNTYDNGAEGNIYGNVIDYTIEVNGSTNSTFYPTYYIGTYGTGVPYNDATSGGKFACTLSCADRYPLTLALLLNTCSPPAINNNWGLNLADNCIIYNQYINLGTGGVWYYGDGSVTFSNTLLNATALQRNTNLSGSTTAIMLTNLTGIWIKA